MSNNDDLWWNKSKAKYKYLIWFYQLKNKHIIAINFSNLNVNGIERKDQKQL